MNSRSSAATCNAPIWFQSLITPSFCKSFIPAVSGHAEEAACGFAARQRERQKMQPVWLFPVDRLMKTSCPSCDTYAPGAGERFHLITAAAVAELRVARLLCCHDCPYKLCYSGSGCLSCLRISPDYWADTNALIIIGELSIRSFVDQNGFVVF